MVSTIVGLMEDNLTPDQVIAPFNARSTNIGNGMVEEGGRRRSALAKISSSCVCSESEKFSFEGLASLMAAIRLNQ